MSVMDTYLNNLSRTLARRQASMNSQVNQITSNIAMTDEYASDRASGERLGNVSESARFAAAQQALIKKTGMTTDAFNQAYGKYNEDISKIMEEMGKAEALKKQEEEAAKKAKEASKTRFLRAGANIIGMGVGLIPGVGEIGQLIASSVSNIVGGAVSMDASGSLQLDVNKMDIDQINKGINQTAYAINNIVAQKKTHTMNELIGGMDWKRLADKYSSTESGKLEFLQMQGQMKNLYVNGDLEGLKQYIQNVINF